MKKYLFGLFAVLLLVLGACGDVNEAEKEVENTETASNNTSNDNDEVVEEDESENNEVENTEEAEPEEADVSREYRNALKSAENYISLMAFSEKGLFEQLTSEYGDQYPEDAAQYAIENLEVDYNEQALKAAENYQELMPMSDQELFDQLTSEYGDQYTEDQAQYALDNLSD